MSPPTSSDRGRTQRFETAADWAALAESGSLTEDRRLELERWLQEPANGEAFDAARDAWHLLDVLEGSPELAELRANAPVVAPEAAPVRRAWPWLAAAAAVILAVVGTLFWSRLGPKVYETQIGELVVVELEDGTVVHLDTDTRLTTRFSRDRRNVTMERGRALFDVARDPSRPFTVTSADVTVTAVGTQFDVYRRSATVDVVGVEGRVKVATAAVDAARPAEARALDVTRGQLARVASVSGAIEVESVDLQSVLVWTTGQIDLDMTPLAEAVAAFNRYSRQQMRLLDPALESIRVSGRFHFAEGEAFRASLARSAPIQTYQTSDGTIVITSAAPKTP